MRPFSPRTIAGVATLVGLATILMVPASADAQLVSRFEVTVTAFSPDGDGTQDATKVVYALSDTSLSLSVIVFEADSITPVDTLRAPAFDASSGNQNLTWTGQRWNGTPAPEGTYVVTLNAVGEDDPDVLRSLPVFVDVTPPTTQILSAIPNPYAPGLAGGPPSVAISFVVGDASPVSTGRLPDALRSTFTNPSNAAVAVTPTIAPPFAGGDGAYVMSWNAASELSTLADGEYRVTLTLNDAAGYASSSSYHFVLDTRTPDVRVTSQANNASFRTAPDSLYGYAFDARGIDSLSVRYASTRPYRPVTSAFVLDDSLRFAVVLADSVHGEGSYEVDLRAVDRARRVMVHSFSFQIDLTAPAPPQLAAFDGKTHAGTYTLSGTAAEAVAGSFVRIIRNGVLVDSVAISLSTSFSARVPLVPGRNELVAVLRDAAFNASGPSNTVVVRFESGSGLFMPIPFAPGASFQVNAVRVAAGASLRVFDVTGDLVAKFESRDARQFYSFPWNGVNGSGASVRRGPLVAVGSIDYDDGTHDVLRRVFLFDPEGQP